MVNLCSGFICLCQLLLKKNQDSDIENFIETMEMTRKSIQKTDPDEFKAQENGYKIIIEEYEERLNSFIKNYN
jgi:hypothetical protein